MVSLCSIGFLLVKSHPLTNDFGNPKSVTYVIKERVWKPHKNYVAIIYILRHHLEENVWGTECG